MSAAPDNVLRLVTPDDELARVKPAEYTAVYARHTGMLIFRHAKLRIDFRLLEHPGIVLPRWYRIQDYRGGRIRAGKHSAIVRELSDALGTRIRHDRIPVNVLKEAPVLIEVRDVLVDQACKPLSALNRYSVVTRILGRAG